MPLTLVTGAPGWLGSRLVRLLRDGIGGESPADPSEIRCLVQPGSDVAALGRISPDLQITEGDLRDPVAVARFCQKAAGATLFHCAGVIHPVKGVREFYEVNVAGTRNLLEMAERAGVHRAVIVSSNSPLGTNPHPDQLFDESSPYHPYMGYGRSKMQMELVVQQVQQRGKLETVVIRPPWFYGPDQPERQTLFFNLIRKGRFPIVGDGQNRRSMVYVDNLCQGLILARNTAAAVGQTYWIADSRPYTMLEIVGTIENLMKNEFGFKVAHSRLKLPYFASEVARAGDWSLQKLGLYQQKLHVLSEMNQTIACAIAKAERELAYNPQIELEEGMRRSIQWCIEQKIAI